MDTFSRNELYWGAVAQEKLNKSNVLIFGLGGVGSFVAEMLARSGIGNFTVVDFDKVSQSNINRQLIALQNTIGKNKADLVKERILAINPDANVVSINDFYTEDMHYLFEKGFDFVVDAIDSFAFKIELIEYCCSHKIPVITSMGAANRICPEKLYITDIAEVEKVNCAFANRIIKRLKQDGITSNLPMVLSSEKPRSCEKILVEEKIKTQSGKEVEFNKITPSTTPFVAPVAGIFMASFVVRELLK